MTEIADVVPTGTIVATWGNAIRDRTLQRYDDDADRTSEHPSPTGGDLSYLDDTGDLAVYHSSDWRPFLPPGIVLPYGGSSAPTGFLLAQGQAVSRTSYAPLFAVLSTTFGIGDGSTTFNLPDLRQKFPIGTAASGTASTLGGTGGAIDHTHTGASHTHTGPSHTHTQGASGNASVGAANGSTGTSGLYSYDNLPDASPTSNSKAHTHSAPATGAAGTAASGSTTPATGGGNNPPFLTINFIVKT